MLANKRGYDFSSLGSGKTASSLWACDILLEASKISKVLIVCPLSITHAVWVEHILDILPNRGYAVLCGTKEKRIEALNRQVNFYIINHDGIRAFGDYLAQHTFDVIIIDEVDAFKNPKSKRSKAMQTLTKKARAVYGLTGTPTANSPEEAFGIAKVINPTRLPTQYITRWRQLTMMQLGPYTWVPNEQAEKLCFDALQPAIRHKLEDCVDIPDIIYEYRKFDMTPDQARVYKQMYNDQVAEYNNGIIVASTAAVKFTKLLQITAGVVYDIEGQPSVLPMNDRLEEVRSIQKQVGRVIIFVQFINVIKYLKDQLGDQAEVVYGDVKQKDRTRIFKDFEEGKFNILIAQPRVASHGLNLQFCNTIIFWTPILGNNYYRQAIGRVRRSGQVNKQVIINFVSSTAEKQLYKTLETREVSSQILLKYYENLI